MMRILLLPALPLALLAAVGVPSLAAADPIQITSGFVRAGTVDPRAQFAIEGQGLSIEGFAQAFISTLSSGCFPCAPGTTLDLGGAIQGTDALGSGMVDGVGYSRLFFNGLTWTFSSPSFELSGERALTVVRDFTFTGTISGYLLNPFVHGFTEPVFTKTLSGEGIVRGEFLFNADQTPLFFATSLQYEFADTAPVPEPTTLLLVGSGAAIAALRRRRSPQ